MVAIQEYRIVLPFTIEEYKIAQLYMVAKFSASESNADNGDGVEVLKNEPFEDGDRRGQYTHKLYHLASKLPTWLVSLIPKTALTLEEEAWNAYPHCTTILKCPFLNKFRLILKTTHLPDRGTTENALDLDAKTLKKRLVEFIDIATDPVENYSEQEDPSKFKSKRTGRGPLREGWSQTCEPVICAYKCVTVDVPYWGFGSQIEKYISKNAQRRILLEGHRKCFCWLDEWHGLKMEDVRRMEVEITQAMANARRMALRRVAGDEDEDLSIALQDLAADGEDTNLTNLVIPEDEPVTPKLASAQVAKGFSRSTTPRGGSPSLLRRPSLVGPSVALGIATLSASDVDDFSLGGSAPPVPLSKWTSLSVHTKKEIEKDLDNDQHPPSSEDLLTRNDSCESFSSVESVLEEKEDLNPMPAEENVDVVAQYCVDVLDRAINWSKQRSDSNSGHKASGKIAPLQSAPVEGDKNGKQGGRDVEHCVGVLSTAMSVLKMKPSKVEH